MRFPPDHRRRRLRRLSLKNRTKKSVKNLKFLKKWWWSKFSQKFCQVSNRQYLKKVLAFPSLFFLFIFANTVNNCLITNHRYQKAKNRLLKCCYVPATSAAQNRLLFYFFGCGCLQYYRANKASLKRSIILRCLCYQRLLLIRDTWRSKFKSIFNCCSFFQHQCQLHICGS